MIFNQIACRAVLLMDRMYTLWSGCSLPMKDLYNMNGNFIGLLNSHTYLVFVFGEVESPNARRCEIKNSCIFSY